MKHAFNIYPALLVLTPMQPEAAFQLNDERCQLEGTTENDRYFTSCPQTYWGDCLFNGEQKQLLIGEKKDKEACPVQGSIGGRLNVLEPAKFKGDRYTITYIPVLN
jgi:hypothetical protein